MSGVELALAQHADLPAIDHIERSSFVEARPLSTFAAELDHSVARLVVARSAGHVIGYCNYWLVLDEASLLSIAVHPDHRGRGVAGVLLDHMLQEARRAGCLRAILEVRRSNQPALALYQRRGFTVSYLRRAYYGDGEDALVMTCALAGDEVVIC